MKIRFRNEDKKCDGAGHFKGMIRRNDINSLRGKATL